MIDERDLIRHLEDGGDQLWDPAPPPALNLAAITGAVATPAASEVPDATSPAAAAPTSPARREPSTSQQRRRWWPRITAVPAFGLAAGGLACVALGLGIGAAVFGGGEPAPTVASTSAPTPTPVRQVSLQRLGNAPESAEGLARVFATSTGDTLDVKVAGMPPLAPGSFYELWALGTKGRMVSLGNITVDANGRGATSVRMPVALSQFPILDISVEPADGNPTHSGSSMLRSPA